MHGETPSAEETFAGIESLGGEFIRYLLVAIVALAVDVSALVMLRELGGMGHLYAAAIAFGAGLATNYGLSVTWVFSQRTVVNPFVEFCVFTIIGVIGLLWTELIMYVGTDLLGADYRLSKIAAVGAVFFWNFGVRKALLFRSRS